jgi:hypothetical protein
MKVFNTGKTRVRISAVYVRWHIGDMPTPVNQMPLSMRDRIGKSTSLAGGDSCLLAAKEIPLSLKPSQKMALESGESSLWVFGYVEYTNIAEHIEVGFIGKWSAIRHVGKPRMGFQPLLSGFNDVRITPQKE